MPERIRPTQRRIVSSHDRSKAATGSTRILLCEHAFHGLTYCALSACGDVLFRVEDTGIGIPEGYPDYVLHQMVTVWRGGEAVCDG